MSPCDDGEAHEVITAADHAEHYDADILGQYDETAGDRPNPSMWGYCAKCHRGFRWSIDEQQWRRWPGGLGLLPQLNDEELEELHVALRVRIDELVGTIGLASSTGLTAELTHRLRLAGSLDTAIQEARYQLWPPERDYTPRVWGEAWSLLAAWVEQQITGIRRSSETVATQGALAAFLEVRDKLAELDSASNPRIGPSAPLL